jgi:serine/threonine protein kinase
MEYGSEQLFMHENDDKTFSCFTRKEISKYMDPSRIHKITNTKDLNKCLSQKSTIPDIFSYCTTPQYITDISESYFDCAKGFNTIDGMLVPSIIERKNSRLKFYPDSKVIAKGGFGAILLYKNKRTGNNKYIALKIVKKRNKKTRKIIDDDAPTEIIDEDDMDDDAPTKIIDEDDMDDDAPTKILDVKMMDEYASTEIIDEDDIIHIEDTTKDYKSVYYGEDDREITIISKLKSKNILCKIIESKYLGDYKEFQYIAMPNFSGNLKTLQNSIRNLGNVSKLRLIYKIIEQINCLNTNNFYYTDLKPANILFRCLPNKTIMVVLGDIGSIMYTATDRPVMTIIPPRPVNGKIVIKDTKRRYKPTEHITKKGIDQIQFFCILWIMFWVYNTSISFFYDDNDYETIINQINKIKHEPIKQLAIMYITKDENKWKYSGHTIESIGVWINNYLSNTNSTGAINFFSKVT